MSLIPAMINAGGFGGGGCGECEQRFTTYERPILATPMVVKRDGTREELREKLLEGVRLACVKRPVSATDIERLVGEVEAQLQQLGRVEVPSRQVGDRVIAKLSEMKWPTSASPLSVASVT